MKKDEWQKHHGLTTEDMENICMVMEIFTGRVVAVNPETWAMSYNRYITRIYNPN